AWRGGAGHLAPRAVHLVAGLVVLAPNVFPWYVVWLVPFLPFTPFAPLLAFLGPVAYAYSLFPGHRRAVPRLARLVRGAAGRLRDRARAPRGSSATSRHACGRGMKATVTVPALKEAAVIGDLIRRVPWEAIAEVVVVDNGSTDGTAVVAREAGARVVSEPRR